MEEKYNNRDAPQQNYQVTLLNKELWMKFHKLQTEMIVTKSGRRMFPSLRTQVSGLDPAEKYCLLLEFAPGSSCRMKYSSSGGWMAAGSEELQSTRNVYVHPDSPASGSHWMEHPVSFGRVKLTNTTSPPQGHVVLSSMHRYQPRILIVKASDPRMALWAPSLAVVFPETEFVAVTAYQNEKITQLKIDHNPFAKGFRENGQSRCKRKANSEETCNSKIKPEPEEEEIKPILTPSYRLFCSTIPYYGYGYRYPPYHHCSYNYNWLSSYPMRPVQKTSKKLTDFSIRAIMDIA